jgi:mono/diheme cytochrome c family protein
MWTRGGVLGVLGLALLSVVGIGISPAPAADVNALYKEHCLKCHGPEGKGDGESLKKVKGKAVDWTNKAEMSKLTDTELFDIIWQGGGGVGKSKIMPAYKGKLKEEEAKQLAAFVKTLAK